MDSSVDLTHFKLFRAVFEFRYEKSYLLWDRAGHIWDRVSKKWPGAKVINAKPNEASFVLDDKAQFSVQLEKSALIEFNPPANLKSFFENSETFFEIVVSHLNLYQFERLGFRLTYKQKFEDQQSAAEAFLNNKVIHSPKGQKYFNIEGKITEPKYSVRWGGKSVGIRVLLQSEEQKIDFDAPPDIDEVKSVHVTNSNLVLDLDYFTQAKAQLGQINVSQWLSNAYHVIKRDTSDFFGGALNG